MSLKPHAKSKTRATLRCGNLLLTGMLVSAAFLQSAPATSTTKAVSFKAAPLPLSDVRLTGGPLKHAQDLDADYLLRLEPDRMMAYYRKRAGLTPKAEGYSGWDGDGRNLTGHIACRLYTSDAA